MSLTSVAILTVSRFLAVPGELLPWKDENESLAPGSEFSASGAGGGGRPGTTGAGGDTGLQGVLDKIPYTGNEQKKGRRFLLGATHTGFHVEVHETIIGAGLKTHPPHKHEHEEFVIVVEGTLEANLDGTKQLAPAGSVVCFGSNLTHNGKNVGATPCRYYVVELRGSEA